MAMTLAQRRTAYAPEYTKRWTEARLDANVASAVRAVALKIIKNQARYEKISKATGVPWWWIAVTHYRESGMNFSRHLHNGDPLTAKTKMVPAGRPKLGKPPFTFEESAIDAIQLKQLDKVKKWDVVESLLRLEAYNGFGYRGKKIPSPYLWAGTNQSNERGKYVADGKFDFNAVEKQLGVVAIMLGLTAEGVGLFPREGQSRFLELPETGPVPKARPDEPQEPADIAEADDDDLITDPEIILLAQEKLKALGYTETGPADGDQAKFTQAGILAYRNERDLPLSNTIDKTMFVQLMADTKVRDIGRRATASTAEIREYVPQVKNAFRSKILGIFGSIATAIFAFFESIISYIEPARQALAPIYDFFGDIPKVVYMLIVLAICVTYWYLGRKAEKQGAEGFRDGSVRP